MALKIDVVSNWSATLIGFLAPLLAFPYISRIFNLESFGTFLLYLAISSLLTMICDYGFNVTAAREISKIADSKIKIVETINQTIKIKSTLFLIICLIGFLIFYEEYKLNLLYILLYVFVTTFFPGWYFNGLQKSRYSATYIALGKLVTLFFIFSCVNQSSTPADLILYYCLGGAVSLILSWLHLHFDCELFKNRIRVKYTDIFKKITIDLNASLGVMMVTAYTSLPVIILAELSNLSEVANYVSTEKIFKAIEYFITSILVIIFPRFTVGLENNKEFYLKYLLKIELYLIIIGLVISSVSLIFGPLIFKIYYGENYDSDRLRIFLLSFMPLFGSLSILWGSLGLLSISADRKFFNAIFFGALINILLVILISSNFGAIGAAIALFISSAFMPVYMRISFWKIIRSKLN